MLDRFDDPCDDIFALFFRGIKPMPRRTEDRRNAGTAVGRAATASSSK